MPPNDKIEVESKFQAPESNSKVEGEKNFEENYSTEPKKNHEDDFDEDNIENYSSSTKDVNFGDKFSFLMEEELQEAKQRRLCRQPQSDPSGLLGTLFEENGKWMEKCTLHAHVSMEVEHLIDTNIESRSYIRPGGPYKLIRHARVNKRIPVCADYADWYHDPELRYVKDYDIRGYRKRRIQRWLSEALPIHEGERFDRYLVRCYAEAIKELTNNNQEFKTYRDMFPHIVDKWVAVLHLGMLFKRRNMGKTCFRDESELLLKLMREECEILYFKTKIMFFEEPNEKRNPNAVPREYWILHPRNLCGDKPI